MIRRSRLLHTIAVVLALSGCSALPRQTFSRIDQEQALPVGFGSVRQWADAPARDIAPTVVPQRPGAAGRIDVLALSGGGSGGAFAAGLLKGWTKSGRRPRFSIVTGVSTGALIAPYAFLGPEYDGQLEQLYRSGTAASLNRLQDPLSMVSGNGLLDPAPLRRMIETRVDSDLLARIAAEYRQGRRLFIITTNLDAQRPVLWDIGKIAASGRPESRKLVQHILLASASIPAVYPPVLIRSQVNGMALEEMHVDGSATMQFFLPVEALTHIKTRPRPENTHLWVIVNNTLPPEFDMTRQGTIAVASRSFMTLMKSHAQENAKVAQEVAQRAGFDFNLAFIDQQVEYHPDRPFEHDYMDAVFAIGERQATSGGAWRKTIEDVRLRP